MTIQGEINRQIIADGEMIAKRGLRGKQGEQGIQGETGNGISSAVLNADYTLTLTFTDGTSYTTPSIRGQQGATGSQGQTGPQGATGPQGEKGDKGDTGSTGATGNGISSITKTGTVGLVDTYTITFTNGTTTTFTVTNGDTPELTWENITGKPSTFPPSSHTHDDRYYTESEIDSQMSGKANTSHTHTKSNITDFSHTHTKSEVTDFAHTHDDRYYTETEIDTQMGAKQNTLVSGENIKTINNQSVLGSGNISIDEAYIAVYDQTTYAEMLLAFNLGKALVLEVQDSIIVKIYAEFVSRTTLGTDYVFVFSRSYVTDNSVTAVDYRLTKTGWSSEEYTYAPSMANEVFFVQVSGYESESSTLEDVLALLDKKSIAYCTRYVDMNGSTQFMLDTIVGVQDITSVTFSRLFQSSGGLKKGKCTITSSGWEYTEETYTIPTKTSELTNDSGFLTSHQDISGKEDKSNKVTSFSATPSDDKYPSEKLVKESLDGKAELPTVVNDRYLHTNEQGELEWSEVQGGSLMPTYVTGEKLVFTNGATVSGQKLII